MLQTNSKYQINANLYSDGFSFPVVRSGATGKVLKANPEEVHIIWDNGIVSPVPRCFWIHLTEVKNE